MSQGNEPAPRRAGCFVLYMERASTPAHRLNRRLEGDVSYERLVGTSPPSYT
jgi:hypothetical protein